MHSNRIRNTASLSITLLLIFSAATLHAASPNSHWVGTWATAPMAQANTAKPGDLKIGGDDVTVREIVHVSIGGSAIRLQLTNEFSTVPLSISAVQVGASTGMGSDGVVPGSAHAVTFGGKSSVTIPAGAIAVSDEVAMPLAPQSNLAISLYVPMQTLAQLSYHGSALTTNYIAKGDQTAAATLTGASKLTSWYFLKTIDVQTSAKNAGAIVAFGDSITDGAASTRDANHRWPDYLADRLLANAKTKNFGMLNVGIGGNRVLHDGTGPSALARFDHDVLALDGVKYVIILESINDIGGNQRKSNSVTADDLIWAFTQMVERAHAHGIKVIGATLTPYGRAGYSYPPGQAIVEALNNWIRTGGVVDGYVDFYKATQDPANPTQLAAFADSGDHLHPKDDGYKAMADSVDLNIFK
jgi:lysophospholipase L1-like esterase